MPETKLEDLNKALLIGCQVCQKRQATHRLIIDGIVIGVFCGPCGKNVENGATEVRRGVR